MMNVSRNIYVGQSVTPGNFYAPTAAESQFFSSLVMGGYGTRFGGSTITQTGESQGVLLDLIGNIDIPYVGIPNPSDPSAPAVAGVPPILISPFGPRFENNPDTYYQSEQFADLQPPFEMHHVIARLPGQNYEEFFPGGDNRGLIGEAQGTYRIINSGESNLPNPPANEADFYTIINLRLRVNTNATAQLWENGVSKGIYTFRNDDLASANAGTFIKRFNGVGVNTNVADYVFGQSGLVNRALTDDEALTLYHSSNAKWAAQGYAFGDYIFPVRFSNILWNKSGNVLVPTYTVINHSSKTLADPSTWMWDWRLKTNQSNFATQVQLGTTMNLSTNAYPANNGTTITGAGVKYRFRALYTDGSYDPTWTSGVFIDIPPGTGHN